jgi:hypothetical protein
MPKNILKSEVPILTLHFLRLTMCIFISNAHVPMPSRALCACANAPVPIHDNLVLVRPNTHPRVHIFRHAIPIHPLPKHGGVMEVTAFQQQLYTPA